MLNLFSVNDPFDKKGTILAIFVILQLPQNKTFDYIILSRFIYTIQHLFNEYSVTVSNCFL